MAYRVATKQLHIYHTERPTDNICRALQECQGVPETSLHLFWECRRRVRAGVNPSDIELALSLLPVSFLDASATVPTVRLRKFQCFSDLVYWRGFKMMSWRVNRCGYVNGSLRALFASRTYGVSETMPFLLRAVHDVFQCGTLVNYGCTSLIALAMREQRGAETVVQGAQLHACLEPFTIEWSVEPLPLARCHISPPRLA